MKKIEELFDVVYGVNLDLSKLVKDENGINYVGRSKKNNGITAKVQLLKDISPNPANTISVSGGGSVLEAFIQEEPYYSGRDLFYLKPKCDMNINVLQYYCMCIKANQFKYSFGRQANKTLPKIYVPDLLELPKWVTKKRCIKIDDIPDYFLNEGYDRACWFLDNIDQSTFEKKYSGKIDNNQIKLDKTNWQKFKISEIFSERTRGKRQKSSDRIIGDVPYYSASKENNGLTDFISNPSFVSSDALIYTTFGDSYYVEGEFTASDEITILKSNELNKYNGLFISTVLKQEKFRYSFGRKAFKNKINDTTILLPARFINKNDYIPDWDYMEKFIKTINYSISI